MDLMKSYFRWTSKFHQASDWNKNNYSSNLKSDLDADDLLEVCVSVYDWKACDGSVNEGDDC